MRIAVFVASWCNVCTELQHNIMAKVDLKPFGKYYDRVDVDVARGLARKYAIKKVPVIMVREGERELGRMSEHLTLRSVQDFLNKFTNPVAAPPAEKTARKKPAARKTAAKGKTAAGRKRRTGNARKASATDKKIPAGEGKK